MAVEDRLQELSGQLARLGDELSDLAMDVLRQALDAAGDEAADAARAAKVLERRLNRARAAVERAAGLLDGAAADSLAGPGRPAGPVDWDPD